MGGRINSTWVQGYADSIRAIINDILVPVLIAIAFIVFLYGIYNYFILGATNEDKRKEGKTVAFYGVIGFVIIFSIWGIVNIFIGTLNIGGGTPPKPPVLNAGTSSLDGVIAGPALAQSAGR